MEALKEIKMRKRPAREIAGIAAGAAWARVGAAVHGSAEYEIAMAEWEVAYAAWRFAVVEARGYVA